MEVLMAGAVMQATVVMVRRERAMRTVSREWATAPQCSRVECRWRNACLGGAEHGVDVAEGEVVDEDEGDEAGVPTSRYQRQWGGCGRSARRQHRQGGRREL